MSNWTYLCEKCGSIRRRPMSGEGRSRFGAPLTMPRCCEQPMMSLGSANRLRRRLSMSVRPISFALAATLLTAAAAESQRIAIDSPWVPDPRPAMASAPVTYPVATIRGRATLW